MAMGYVSTGMSDRFSLLLISVALQLTLVGQNLLSALCERAGTVWLFQHAISLQNQMDFNGHFFNSEYVSGLYS